MVVPQRMMFFSISAEYALRLMAQMAATSSGEAVRAKDLARQTGVPLPYLSKILRRMVVNRLLISKKGHGGGFMLAKAPSKISFASVLAAVDFEPDPNACVFGKSHCSGTKPCALHPVWGELRDAYFAWAERATLADVSAPGPATGPSAGD